MPKEKFLRILHSKQPKVGNSLFVAIDGRGGSGKSTLAKLLAEQLNATVIQTDDFASWDNPLDWWPLLIEQVFVPIRNGSKVLSYSPSNQWWENSQPKPHIDRSVTDIMILEGVSSSRKEFQDYISFSIFIDTPRDICIQRGIDRDSGSDKTEVEVREMWEKWCKEEDIYIHRDHPKEHADIVIDGTRPFEDQILL